MLIEMLIESVKRLKYFHPLFIVDARLVDKAVVGLIDVILMVGLIVPIMVVGLTEVGATLVCLLSFFEGGTPYKLRPEK